MSCNHPSLGEQVRANERLRVVDFQEKSNYEIIRSREVGKHYFLGKLLDNMQESLLKS